MMATLRTLVWYTVVGVVFLVLYYFVTSYALVIVDAGFTYMQPALKSGAIEAIDRRASTVRSLARDDVIAYQVYKDDRIARQFGRVLALPGATVSVRDGRVEVEGNAVATAPEGLSMLGLGLIVPRDTVFVMFDTVGPPNIPLSHRLVRYRDILGRILWK